MAIDASLPDCNETHRSSGRSLDFGCPDENCCTHGRRLPQVRDQLDTPLAGCQPGFVSGIRNIEPGIK
jgi:hypothetical protein